MSNASNSDHDQVQTTRKLFKQQVIHRFDKPSINPNPSFRIFDIVATWFWGGEHCGDGSKGSIGWKSCGENQS